MEKKHKEMVLWPPQSPELTTADFYLCSHLKDAVQKRRVKKKKVELGVLIEAAAKIRTYSLKFSASRVQSCIPTNKKRFKKKILHSSNYFSKYSQPLLRHLT
jgi:hypothetical protein